jgi:hypothetical protein
MTRQDRILKTLRNAPRPELLRTAPLAGSLDAPRIVDRDGGDYGAGVIRGVSLVTRGEALGHGLWLDDTFVHQVSAALQLSAAGVKSRFTHPDMSSDGLAKFLGRTTGGLIDGKRVLGDLHLAQSAHRSPEGDLAGYVLDRTEEDPASFGASIVFFRDFALETKHAGMHGATIGEDELGQYVADWSGFVSPDPENRDNLPHARLASLDAADLVDEPAANPDGLLSAGPVAQFVGLADYALGLRTGAPTADVAVALGVDPDRLRGFVKRYLTNRKLQIVPQPGEPAMSDPVTKPADETTPAAPVETPPVAPPPAEPEPHPTPATDAAAASAGPDRPLSAYMATFGDGPGARYFADGVKYEDALARQNAALRQQLAAAEDRLTLAQIEHPTPLAAGQGGSKKTFRDHVKLRK